MALSDQLISSHLDGGQLAQIFTDCQRTSRNMMAKPFSYEGDSKNLEKDYFSRGNSLKQEHSTNCIDLLHYSKKVHTQTQLQSVSGAESAHDVDHESVGQIAPQVPDFGSEEAVSSHFNRAQIPMDDPNCSELDWESTIALHDLSQFILNDDLHQPQGGSTLQSQDCFVFGSFSSTTQSSLPNEVVTNAVKTIADNSLTHTFSDAQAGVNHLVNESNFHPEQRTTVSDFSELCSHKSSLSQSFKNIRLHSLNSSNSVVISQTETISSHTDLGSDVCLTESMLMDIMKDIPEYEKGFWEVHAVDFGSEELPAEFPESGSLINPPIVNKGEVSDEENRNKKGSQAGHGLSPPVSASTNFSPAPGLTTVNVKEFYSLQSTNGPLESESYADSESNYGGSNYDTEYSPDIPSPVQDIDGSEDQNVERTSHSGNKKSSPPQFLWDCLHDPKCNPSILKWVSEKDGHFVIVRDRKDELASLWFNRRNCKTKKSYKYQHFTRAMRNYYKKNLECVEGKKFQYRIFNM